jgi:hypothetical protein
VQHDLELSAQDSEAKAAHGERWWEGGLLQNTGRGTAPPSGCPAAGSLFLPDPAGPGREWSAPVAVTAEPMCGRTGAL